MSTAKERHIELHYFEFAEFYCLVNVNLNIKNIHVQNNIILQYYNFESINSNYLTNQLSH